MSEVHALAIASQMAGDGLVGDVRKDLGHLGGHGRGTARAHHRWRVVVGHSVTEREKKASVSSSRDWAITACVS